MGAPGRDGGPRRRRADLDGRGALRAVAEAELAALAPRAVAALDQPSDVERAVDAGTDEFVTKPVNKRDLLLRVRSLLKARLYKKDLDRALAYIEAVEKAEKN